MKKNDWRNVFLDCTDSTTFSTNTGYYTRLAYEKYVRGGFFLPWLMQAYIDCCCSPVVLPLLLSDSPSSLTAAHRFYSLL